MTAVPNNNSSNPISQLPTGSNTPPATTQTATSQQSISSFTFQYCNQGLLLQGKPNPAGLSSPPPPGALSPSPSTRCSAGGASRGLVHRPSPTTASHASFYGSNFGGSPRGAIRPILGFRPDLDKIHQQQLIKFHRAQQLHLFTDKNAKISTFFISCDQKTGKLTVNDEDLKFRLKALAVASLQFHMSKRDELEEENFPKVGSEDEILLMHPEEMASRVKQPPKQPRKTKSSSPKTESEKEAVGQPGSLKYTRTLIGDIDIMFHHCMTSDDVSSPEEGAAVAFRHTLDQLAKANLFSAGDY